MRASTLDMFLPNLWVDLAKYTFVKICALFICYDLPFLYPGLLLVPCEY